jgi:hypothetical protein
MKLEGDCFALLATTAGFDGNGTLLYESEKICCKGEASKKEELLSQESSLGCFAPTWKFRPKNGRLSTAALC